MQTAINAPAPAYFAKGQVLKNRYEIGDEIGRGGSSVVYRARDRGLNQDVAVKLLVPPPLAAEMARERMRREVQAAREVTHSNVVSVFDFVDEGPWSCVVMELIDGPDLQAHVYAQGSLDAQRAARIGAEVASALASAHHHGILHRDVKPSNVLLDASGTARLADFGSAKMDTGATMTGTGGIVGTISYVPPEVFAGQRPDARADIYALGLSLYFMLTGALPEGGSLHRPPPPAEDGYHPQQADPAIPTWLNNIVARATAQSAQHRFPTAQAMYEALKNESDPGASGLSTRTNCLLCQTPDPLGFGVCPSCGGASGMPDALLFVTSSRADRHRVHTVLNEVFGQRLSTPDAVRAAAGDAALIAVHHSTAELAMGQLADRAIPTRIVPARAAWTALPVRFKGMVLAIAGVGIAAGLGGATSFFLSGPLVAMGLTFLGHRITQRPVIRIRHGATDLPENVRERVLETLRALPDGAARRLLGDVVRVAHRLYRNPGDWTESLDALLISSCAAAEQLDHIDASLTALAHHPCLASGQMPNGWLDALSCSEQARAGGVQRFLEVIATLARLNAMTASFDDKTGRMFDDLAAEMKMQWGVQREARAELDQFLGSADR